jgi:Nif-specific regulatory protein
LLIGRGQECEILIADPTVSRRHCEVCEIEGRVHFRDTGASNPTLVNGRETGEGALHVGDEMRIGSVELLVTTTIPPARPRPRKQREGSTVSISEADAVYLRPDPAGLAELRTSQGVGNLIQLFHLGRDLSGAASVEDLCAALAARIQAKFATKDVWILRVGEDQQPFFLAGGTSRVNAPPASLIHQAIEKRQGMLQRTRGEHAGARLQVYNMVAPLLVSGEPIGALALRTSTPAYACDESDLEFFIAIANQASPFFVALELKERLRRENEKLRSTGSSGTELVGVSKAIVHVRGLARKAAQSGLTILILGETGTGKDLVARYIHDASARRNGPFVVVNCAAIPRDLIDSELFGHERGAFTGANQVRLGFIELAHGGTLFLDEIGELSNDLQARLLRVLETGTFHRVGSARPIHVDVRVVAATNINVVAAVERGAFRRDLYHRLNGFEIDIPPLRERPSDIPALARHYLAQCQQGARYRVKGFTDDALEYLRSLSWRGNVRELRNCIQRAVATAAHAVLDVEDLRAVVCPDQGPPSGDGLLPLAEVEKRHIAKVLRVCEGRVMEAAGVLQIARSTLYSKIAEYGIET